MKPDKIYVHEGVHLGMLTLTTIPVDASDEEIYIRKDALLEWAKDFKAKTGWYEIEVAMDDLIDKLNSM